MSIQALVRRARTISLAEINLKKHLLLFKLSYCKILHLDFILTSLPIFSDLLQFVFIHQKYHMYSLSTIAHSMAKLVDDSLSPFKSIFLHRLSSAFHTIAKVLLLTRLSMLKAAFGVFKWPHDYVQITCMHVVHGKDSYLFVQTKSRNQYYLKSTNNALILKISCYYLSRRVNVYTLQKQTITDKTVKLIEYSNYLKNMKLIPDTKL